MEDRERGGEKYREEKRRTKIRCEGRRWRDKEREETEKDKEEGRRAKK